MPYNSPPPGLRLGPLRGSPGRGTRLPLLFPGSRTPPWLPRNAPLLCPAPLPLPRADDSSGWAPLDGSPGTLPPGLSLTCAVAAEAGPSVDDGDGRSGAGDGGESGNSDDPSRGGGPSSDDQEGGGSGGTRKTNGLSGEADVPAYCLSGRQSACIHTHTPSVFLIPAAQIPQICLPPFHTPNTHTLMCTQVQRWSAWWSGR